MPTGATPINNVENTSLLFVEQGSAPATPASGRARMYRGTDGKWYGVDAAGLVEQVSQPPTTWTLDANDAGTSLAGITTNGATWDLSTYLRCVSTATTWKTARINQNITVGMSWAVSCEVELAADFSSSTDFVRVMCADDSELAASNNFHGFSIAGDGTSLLVQGTTTTSGYGTLDRTVGWHGIKAVSTPSGFFGLWDDVIVAGTSNRGLAGDIFRPFVWAYGTNTTRWRNIRGWSGVTDPVALYGTFPTA